MEPIERISSEQAPLLPLTRVKPTEYIPHIQRESCWRRSKVGVNKCLTITGIIAVTLLTIWSTYSIVTELRKRKSVAWSSVELGFEGVALILGCMAAGVYTYMRYKHPHLLGLTESNFNPVKLLNSDKDFNPLIDDVLKELEGTQIYQYWIGIHPNINIKEHLQKSLNRGVCYGTTCQMLQMMSQHHSLNSSELIDRLDVKKVVFYQVLGNMIHDIIKEMKKQNVSDIYPAVIKIVSDSNLVNQHLIPLSDICLNYLFTPIFWNVSIPGNNLIEKKAMILVLDLDDSEDMHKSFKAFIEENSRLYGSSSHVVAGTIGLIENALQVKNKPHSAHSIFYQYDQGKCRFFDYATAYKGFYDVDKPEELTSTLLKHINLAWSKYEYKKIVVSLHFIPKAKVEYGTFV
jgi:hypothetical protein